jgi:hypothetical protein
MPPRYRFSLLRLIVLSCVTGIVVGMPLMWIGGTAGLLYALAMFAMLSVMSPAFLQFFLRSPGSGQPLLVVRALICAVASGFGIALPLAVLWLISQFVELR